MSIIVAPNNVVPLCYMIAWINKGYLKYKYFKETILLINWLMDSCMQYQLGLKLLINIKKKTSTIDIIAQQCYIMLALDTTENLILLFGKSCYETS